MMIVIIYNEKLFHFRIDFFLEYKCELSAVYEESSSSTITNSMSDMSGDKNKKLDRSSLQSQLSSFIPKSDIYF